MDGRTASHELTVRFRVGGGLKLEGRFSSQERIVKSHGVKAAVSSEALPIKLFTVSEVCFILKVSRATVYRLMKNGLRYCRVGAARRISKEMLDAYMMN